MSRKGTRAILSLVMILGLVTLTGADEPEEYYVVDAKIMAVPADDQHEIMVKGENMEMQGAHGSTGAGNLVLGTLSDLQIGRWKLTFDEHRGLFWNGKPEQPAEAMIELLIEPRLHVVAGEKAVIMARSQLQYFEATGDGQFVLHTSEQDDAPGVEFGCTVTPDEDSRVVLDIDLKLTLMQSREEISGVKLDVGRPILLTREIASRLLIAQNQWALVSAQQVESASENRGHVLLCLLRVRKN